MHKAYTQHFQNFSTCLDTSRFYDAHEVLEAIWFPRRFEDDLEIKFIKGLINAAVSFELTKRGRPIPASRAWKNYEKYRPLLEQLNSVNLPYYKEISKRLEAMRTARIQ